jgi:hypothetical protein
MPSRAVKTFFIVIMMTCVARGSYGQAGDARGTATTPVLVELFTSEGCSSCPPADALLQRMDASQPEPGVQLVVLSEHVDYWDHDGWKDPYSSALATERQSDYVRALGLQNPYTPQLIVDGAAEMHANGGAQISQVLQKAAAAAKVSVRLGSVTVDAGSPAILRAHIEINGDSAKRNADVYLAIAVDHAESQVLRGENAGRHLTHVAVVQELRRVGKLEKGKSFNQDVQMKLKSGTDSKNIRVIAFVQEPGPGRVLGAALQKTAN